MNGLGVNNPLATSVEEKSVRRPDNGATATPTRLSGRSANGTSTGSTATPKQASEPPTLLSPTATIDSERSVIVVDESPANAPGTRKSALDHVLAKNSPATPGAVRKIVEYDNSLRKLPTSLVDSDESDSDSDDLATLMAKAHMDGGAKDLNTLKEEKQARSGLRDGSSSPPPAAKPTPARVTAPAARAAAAGGAAKGEDDEQSDSSEDLATLVHKSIGGGGGGGGGGSRKGASSSSMMATGIGGQGAAGAAAAAATAEGKRPAAEKRRAAPEVAKQLRFLGQHFKQTIKSDEVKSVLEAEKAKQEVYTFEWEANERKPEWKQALLLSAQRPVDGIRFLTKQGMLKDTPEAKGKWLSHYRKMVLDNPVVIDWLCLDPAASPILEAMIDFENELAGTDLDIAFRRFVMKMDYLPAGELLDTLLKAFGNEYYGRNAHRKDTRSAEAATYLVNGMLVLSNLYHTRSKAKKIRIADWLTQSQGRNGGQDFPTAMLEELFANMVTLALTFEGSPGGYQGERRHGWLLHKTVDARSWKKHWTMLTEKGELILLPEEGAKSGEKPLILDLREGELRTTQSERHVLALQLPENVHLLQTDSQWALELWTKHCKKFCRPSERSEKSLVFKDAFSPSPIRDALKGKGSNSKRRSTDVSNQKGTLRFGAAGLVSPRLDKPGPKTAATGNVDDDDLPEGALEALQMMDE